MIIFLWELSLLPMFIGQLYFDMGTESWHQYQTRWGYEVPKSILSPPLFLYFLTANPNSGAIILSVCVSCRSKLLNFWSLFFREERKCETWQRPGIRRCSCCSICKRYQVIYFFISCWLLLPLRTPLPPTHFIQKPPNKRSGYIKWVHSFLFFC